MLLLMAAAGTTIWSLRIRLHPFSAAIPCMFVLLRWAGASSGRRSSRARLRPHWRRCVVRGSCSATTRNMSYGRRSDLAEFVVFVATVAVSDLVFTSSARRMPFQLRSPIVRRPSASPRAGGSVFNHRAGPCRRGRSSRCDCRMPLDRRPAAAPGSSRRGRSSGKPSSKGGKPGRCSPRS